MRHEDAGTLASGAQRHLSQPLRLRLRALLAAIAVVPLVLACTRVTSLESAPASALRVTLFFHGALVPGQDATVGVQVRDDHSNFVEFTGGQRLSIDGVQTPKNATALPGLTLTVRRLAPGANFYHLVYTDERGRQTAVAIPGPRADFAILQPAAASRVPIPKAGGASGSPGPTPAPYSPRSPALTDAPLTVRYGLPYLPAGLPTSHVVGQPSRYIVRLYAHGPCTSQWPQCVGVVNAETGSPHAPTGTATIDDSFSLWGSGFETFAPGAGVIGANVTVGWDVPSTGFLDCYVQFDDAVSVPLTWV
jgi:hypothetical protein